jgi:hypothetical protein
VVLYFREAVLAAAAVAVVVPREADYWVRWAEELGRAGSCSPEAEDQQAVVEQVFVLPLSWDSAVVLLALNAVVVTVVEVVLAAVVVVVVVAVVVVVGQKH